MTKKSCCTSVQLSWCKEYNGTNGVTLPKRHVAPHFNYPDLSNAMVSLMMPPVSHWCWCWHHMTLASMVSHDPTSHVAIQCECLDLRNAGKPLMMLLVSHDINASTNGIIWPKSHVAPHFNCLDLRIAVVPLSVPLVSCDANVCADFSTIRNGSCCTSF